MKTKTSFRDVYSKPGFRARTRFACGIQGDNKARVVKLERRQKKVSALDAVSHAAFFETAGSIARVILTLGPYASTWTSNTGEQLVKVAA